jgi:uncharacterized protein
VSKGRGITKMRGRWFKRGTAASVLGSELKPPDGHQSSESAPLYRLVNQDRSTTLAGRVRLAGSSITRRSGLRRCASLEIAEGLAIAPCEAIHTFGMRFSIDVIFLDSRYRIRRIAECVRPNRIAVCLAAALAVELAPGTLRRSRSLTGDLLRFELVADPDQARPDEEQAEQENPGASAELHSMPASLS